MFSQLEIALLRAEGLLSAIFDAAVVLDTPHGPVIAAAVSPSVLGEIECYGADREDFEPDADAEPDERDDPPV